MKNESWKKRQTFANKITRPLAPRYLTLKVRRIHQEWERERGSPWKNNAVTLKTDSRAEGEQERQKERKATLFQQIYCARSIMHVLASFSHSHTHTRARAWLITNAQSSEIHKPRGRVSLLFAKFRALAGSRDLRVSRRNNRWWRWNGTTRGLRGWGGREREREREREGRTCWNNEEGKCEKVADDDGGVVLPREETKFGCSVCVCEAGEEKFFSKVLSRR